MGVRDPDDYVFWMNVTEANEVADKIEQLKEENELANKEIERLRQVVKHQGIQLVVNKNK